MIQIEELMQYTTRRKVEAIAAELGYAKATEYPEEVLEEVAKRYSKKKRSHTAVAEEFTQEQTINNAQADLADTDEGAQSRAAAMRVGSDALTLYYYATGNFTVPGLKEKVDESRGMLKQALKGLATAYDPENFLSPTHLAQMTGRGGSQKLISGSSSPLNEPSPNGNSKPLNKSEKPKDNGSKPSG